jgi:DNA-binding MarR family transcriptional regulator
LVTERNASEPAPSEEAPTASGRRLSRKEIGLGVLDDHLGYFVRRLQVWIFQDFERALARYDIRPAQYSVLVVIEANPGLSQADLADALGIQRTRLVLLLDDLERRGLTRRLRLPSDRRYHALALTRDGQKKLKRIKSLAAVHEARVEEVLGPGRRNVLLPILRDFIRMQGQ